MNTPLKLTICLSLVASLCLADASSTFHQRYDEALKAYNAGDFTHAYALLSTLWENNPEDAEMNFYLGRSALELKKYDEAGIAFDRVLMINPNHARTRLEMARLYYETKQYEAAQRELNAVMNEQLPQNVQEMALTMQKAIKTQEDPHTFSGALMLSLDYDTNIANDVGRGVTQNVFTSINDKRDGWGLAEILLLKHAYDLGEKGGWRWESNFLAYNKTVFNESDRNLAVFTLGTGPTYTFESYKVSFLASYAKVNLGSEDYLGAKSFSVNLKKMLSSTLMAEAEISRKTTRYDDETSTSDFDSTVYSIGLRKSFNEGAWLLSSYLSYTDDKERDTTSVQYGVSKNEWAYKIEISNEIMKGLRGSLAYMYKDIDYNEYDTLLAIQRSDRENYFNAGLSYAIDKQSSVLLNHAYTDRTSNNALGEYTKNVTSLTYVRTF
jgi:tetratricopeptide (TPR) repeat protein